MSRPHPVIELAEARARRGQAVPCDPRLGLDAPRRAALRLVLGDALGLLGLVLFLIVIFHAAPIIGVAVGDPDYADRSPRVAESIR